MGQHEQLFCSLDTEGGPGMGGLGPAENTSGATGFNLLNWDGHSVRPGMFPEPGHP